MQAPTLKRPETGKVADFLNRAKQLELLDRSYQIAAQTFVAMMPLILVITVLLTGGQQYLANALINRFELVGFAAKSVRDLLQSETGQVYWVGVLLSLYSAFSLSKRVSRAYTSIWAVPPLPLTAQWRGLLWIVVQAAMIALVTTMRRVLWGQSGGLLAVLTFTTILATWIAAEFCSQWLLTSGEVARRRLILAAVLVAISKAGTAVWALYYLAHSMSRQAELYGPLGVVFAIFTYLLVTSVTMLVATLLAAVITESSESQGTAVDELVADER